MLKAVVIDTGIDKCYIDSRILGGICVNEDENGYYISNNYEDYIGHGTGTSDVILKNSSNIEIFQVRIYDKDIYISPDRLCFALEYIEANVDFDILQISSGIPTYSKRLHELIRKIIDGKNCCVVSAFDNQGAISYPAAFEEVIGVDINHCYSKKTEYDVIDGNVIDIRGADIFYRMRWLHGKNNIVKGSSFLASYITAMISEMKITDYRKENVMLELKKTANVLYPELQKESINAKEFVEKIKKAVVFPFNKEIHCIAAFEDMLSFEIVGYYDVKHKFLIGSKVNDILKYTDNQKVIQNIDKMDWNDDFDTIICGHVGELDQITKRDSIFYILEKCKEYNKKAYFLDDLTLRIGNYRNSENVFSPYVEEDKRLLSHFGKLRVTNKPVLAVMGTSSRQGKFSIQLNLLRELKTRGINVDGIGTEPTSPFFGYSQIYTYGYGTNRAIPNGVMIRMLNDMVWNLEYENVDLILAGSQSGTIPFDLRNEALLPVTQYNFLLGINPDGVILCVNEIDDIDYIKKTIAFIEAVGSAKVIAIVMSETRNMQSYTILGVKKKSNHMLTRDMLKSTFQLPVFSLFSLDIVKLADVVLDYYTGSGDKRRSDNEQNKT